MLYESRRIKSVCPYAYHHVWEWKGLIVISEVHKAVYKFMHANHMNDMRMHLVWKKKTYLLQPFVVTHDKKMHEWIILIATRGFWLRIVQRP